MAHSAIKPKVNKTKKSLVNSADRLPAHWDSTMNDLTEFKATPAEIARRKASHTSKNQLIAKIELQRRALNSAVKSTKKPLPAAFVREVLPKPENVLSEVTDLSSQTLAICADRILERSARLTAPSVSSSSDFQTVNPSVTILPENSANLNSTLDEEREQRSASKMLPVQITPMVRTRLDRLAEAVTAPVALNEPSLVQENERKEAGSTLSNESKTSTSNKPNGNLAPSIVSTHESENSNKVPLKTDVKKSRLPEKVAVLEELFSALQIDATDAGLLAKSAENGDDNSNSTLSGHTALLVRVLIGLVARIRHLESELSETETKMQCSTSIASAMNLLTERVTECERKIEGFKEELHLTSGATTESLQRIRAELETICINKPPSVANNCSTQSVNEAVNLPPVLDRELDDFGDDFDAEPWLNPTEKKIDSLNENINIENVENKSGNKGSSISPPPSSIHYPSGESTSSSVMFGDRLGIQLAELTRQHEQARARLLAMQRSVHSMGRFGIAPKP